MISKDKNKLSKEAGPVPWSAAIFFNFIFILAILLVIFGLFKLVKYFWLL
jgi:hypothetical protein